MKRIALVGCSHTDYLTKLETPTDHWSFNMLKYGVQIDNYARHGQGNSYIDFVLRYILANKIHYDCVIVQMTGNSRWMFPVIDKDQGLDLVTKNISENYNHKMFDNTWGYSNKTIPPQAVENLQHYIDYCQINNSQYHGEFEENGQNIASYTSDIYRRSISIYEKLFPKFFYWDFQWTDINNIGYDTNFRNTVIQEHGDIFFVNLLDDTMHLHPLGQKYLWDNYLFKSYIGDYLTNK